MTSPIAVEYGKAAHKLGALIQQAIREIVAGSRVSFNADVTVRYNAMDGSEVVVVRMHSKVD